MNKAWLNRYCSNGGGSGGAPPVTFVPPLISSSRIAHAKSSEFFTYQATLSQGSTLAPCEIMWQVSSPNQTWLTIDPITGMMSGMVPSSLAGLTIPVYLRAENCVGEDTIQIDLIIATGVKLWKVWYGNAGEYYPPLTLEGEYTQDSIFFLDNNNSGQNVNNSSADRIVRSYTIYPPSSKNNEYQVFAIPHDSYAKTLVFTSNNFPVSFTKVQELIVQGVLCDIYRTDGRSAGGFSDGSEIHITTEG